MLIHVVFTAHLVCCKEGLHKSKIFKPDRGPGEVMCYCGTLASLMLQFLFYVMVSQHLLSDKAIIWVILALNCMFY